LCGPFISGMSGHSGMDNAPCLMMHNDKNVKWLEE
jgi:hypothetical protein